MKNKMMKIAVNIIGLMILLAIFLIANTGFFEVGNYIITTYVDATGSAMILATLVLSVSFTATFLFCIYNILNIYFRGIDRIFNKKGARQ
ncbi:hypothetical protein [Billgrantia endophytica]|uniref:hypothetical protein n=1 Tax=Billgrantia endophytica TaxID=2033802 RepID=UPI001054EF2C|nr:hypothetical protein [Halomonas endophytica]